MPTALELAEHRTLTQEIVGMGLSVLADFMESLDPWNASPVKVKAATEIFYPELVQGYGDTIALVHADAYDAWRMVPPSAASFRSTLAALPPTDQAQAVARWGLGPLFQETPDVAATLAHLEQGAQRLMMQPGRETFFQSAFRDPVRTGVARVLGGANPCRFCTMLASRGAVYRDEDTAGAARKFHSACHCSVVSVRSRDDYPEDYDLDAIRRAYAEGRGLNESVS